MDVACDNVATVSILKLYSGSTCGMLRVILTALCLFGVSDALVSPLSSYGVLASADHTLSERTAATTTLLAATPPTETLKEPSPRRAAHDTTTQLQHRDATGEGVPRMNSDPAIATKCKFFCCFFICLAVFNPCWCLG